MKYCAFLRGVNVNGTAMKMVEVCDVFKKAEMKDVSSVLATGNILFESDEAPENLKQKLEKHFPSIFITKHFCF